MNTMPEINAIGESYNNLMESLGSEQRLQTYTQETTSFTMGSKTASITQYSHCPGQVDVELVQDGSPIFLANMSKGDAEDFADIFNKLAETL